MDITGKSLICSQLDSPVIELYVSGSDQRNRTPFITEAIRFGNRTVDGIIYVAKCSMSLLVIKIVGCKQSKVSSFNCIYAVKERCLTGWLYTIFTTAFRSKM